MSKDWASGASPLRADHGSAQKQAWLLGYTHGCARVSGLTCHLEVGTGSASTDAHAANLSRSLSGAPECYRRQSLVKRKVQFCWDGAHCKCRPSPSMWTARAGKKQESVGPDRGGDLTTSGLRPPFHVTTTTTQMQQGRSPDEVRKSSSLCKLMASPTPAN